MVFNFGPLDAEGDPNLLTYFHQTTQALEIADFANAAARCIYVGRQGSGKTAMTTWLASTGGVGRTILTISPDTHRIILEGNDQTASDVRFMARLELMVEVGRRLRANKRLTGTLEKSTKSLCEDGWLQALGGAASLVKGASAFGFGLQLGTADRNHYLGELRKDGRSAKLWKLMQDIAANHNVMVVVDSPEDIIGQGTDTLSVENARRTGAILSALTDLHKTGVRVVCYLREQVYQMVRQEYDNGQQYEDQVDRLRWSSTDLVEMVRKRIQWLKGAQADWASVFEEGADEFIDRVFPLLSSGPRDVIYLLNESARGASARISVGDVMTVAPALKRDRIQNLTAQHRQWPSVSQVTTEVIDTLVNEHADGQFKRGRAQAIFRRLYTTPNTAVSRLISGEKWIARVQAGSPTIEEVLFTLGMLGFADRHNAKRFPWENASIADFNSSTDYFLSPLFLLD